MLWSIAKNEILAALRDKRITVLTLIVSLLVMLATTAGLRKYQIAKQEKEHAQNTKREQWLNQGDKHPHIAAHFGTFAFMPQSVLSFLDFGLSSFAGTVIYLEAHKQHDFLFRPAQENDGAIRFGEFSVALVLQLLIPLVIIFLTFSTFTKEREGGTLKLLLTQGISIRKIAYGKVLGNYLLILLILFPFLILAAFFLISQTDLLLEAEILLRLQFLLILYALYFLIFTALCVFISSVSKTSKTSLLSLLSLWVFLAIIVPKVAANIGDNLHPLPSAYQFRMTVEDEIKNGVNGHNPRDKRLKAFEKAILAKYNVDSISKLPINYEGEVMKYGENYSSQIYNKHFKNIEKIMDEQNKITSIASFVTPFLSIRGISMALASTDLYTTIDFQKHAEKYRMDFVQVMNNDMAVNSKPNSFDTYKRGTEFWGHIENFEYKAPHLSYVVGAYQVEIISLLFWILMSLGILYFLLPKTAKIL